MIYNFKIMIDLVFYENSKKLSTMWFKFRRINFGRDQNFDEDACLLKIENPPFC